MHHQNDTTKPVRVQWPGWQFSPAIVYVFVFEAYSASSSSSVRFTSLHFTSHYFTSHHFALHHFTLHHCTLHHFTSHHFTWHHFRLGSLQFSFTPVWLHFSFPSLQFLITCRLRSSSLLQSTCAVWILVRLSLVHFSSSILQFTSAVYFCSWKLWVSAGKASCELCPLMWSAQPAMLFQHRCMFIRLYVYTYYRWVVKHLHRNFQFSIIFISFFTKITKYQ